MKSLPYVFDLYYDVKTISEFKREYNRRKELLSRCVRDLEHMERLAEEHKIKLK